MSELNESERRSASNGARAEYPFTGETLIRYAVLVALIGLCGLAAIAVLSVIFELFRR